MNDRPTPAPLRATPRTAEALWRFNESKGDVVSADFARQLERELQDATAAATGAKELADAVSKLCRDAKASPALRLSSAHVLLVCEAALARYQRTATTAGEGKG